MKLFRNGIRVWALAIAAPALVLMTMVTGGTAAAQVSIGISVNFAPPELPVYEQPLCPGEGYIWTPGYWAWDPDYGDYYWVPGTWVLAPQPGYLWTPPYWGWSGAAFVFHEGYWGPRVGFYGGINYGYGYTGRGYYGGRWERDRFYYNRSVNNVNVTQIHNVYNKTVVNNINVTRVSYNGGNGGIRERANRQEEEAARERHMGVVATQQQHIQEARSDRALRASDNHGKPPIAATDRPGQFRGGNVVAAKEGKYNSPPSRGAANNASRPDNANRQPEANRPTETARPENRVDRNDRPPNARGPENNANRPTYVHPSDVPKANRPDRPPSSGNAKADQKYQQRNDNMYKKQEQDRQNLQKKQDQQHARAEQQRADDARKQQMEKQHQQQTQKMEQRQQQQQQKMERQAPKPKQQPQPKQQPPKQQAPPHDQKP